MNLKDDDLKRFYRSFINSRSPENRRECPSLEELVSFFESRGRTGKKLKIVDHVTNCSACAQEFEFLLELQRYQEKIASQVRECRPAKRFFHSIPASVEGAHLLWRLSSVLVGMILVVTSIVTILQNWGPRSETRAMRSSLTLIQPAPEQSIAPPMLFKWKRLEGAETYVLELFNEALLSVWKSPEIALTQLVLPPDVVEHLQPGQRYFWLITAFSDGEKVAESDLSQFMVTQKLK
jgi:hypothetical protein